MQYPVEDTHTYSTIRDISPIKRTIAKTGINRSTFDVPLHRGAPFSGDKIRSVGKGEGYSFVIELWAIVSRIERLHTGE